MDKYVKFLDDNDIIQLTIGGLRKLTVFEKYRLKRKGVVTNYKWVVTSETIFEYKGKSITVPINFLSDGSSGGPDYGSAWIIHDWLYACHKYDDGSSCTRIEADDIMTVIMEHERNSTLYTKLFIWVSKMNIFWLFSKAWNSSGYRGVEKLDKFVI